MSDIDKLESRITAALDRIRQGVDQMSVAATKAAEPVPEIADETAALRYQLQEEQTVNAQFEERIRVLKDRDDNSAAQLATLEQAQGEELATLAAEIQTLRASNADLLAENEKLRSAGGDSSADAEAKIKALTAQRATDVAQMDAIISELKPLIEKA